MTDANELAQSSNSMAKTIVVRQIRRSDFDCWLKLWNGYNTFYGRAGSTALEFQITLTTWHRFFDPYEPVHALVAVRDNQLVGLAHYLLHRSTTAIEPSIYLQDLFASEDARGQGIGRSLIQAVYDYALNAGISRVYWQTHETNTAAMHLYDKVAERSRFVVYRHQI